MPNFPVIPGVQQLSQDEHLPENLLRCKSNTSDNTALVVVNYDGNKFGSALRVRGSQFLLGDLNQSGDHHLIGTAYHDGNIYHQKGDYHLTGNIIHKGDHNVTGNIIANGDIQLTGADFAEDFDIAEEMEIEDGTLMSLADDGRLKISDKPYDKKIAGVVSGAGSYKPAIILDKQQTNKNRKSIALVGKVFCKAEATLNAIEVGDLLTTSAIFGHAMKADDPFKAFGAVVGKALKPLKTGTGLIPILVALQ